MIELPTPHDFPIACFRFCFRITQPFSLPTYKGSTFHGGFGHAISDIGGRFWDYFFRPTTKKNGGRPQTIPKPFMLIPPLEEKTLYRPGDEMQCGLILFGDAIQHFMIAFAALEKLGQELGLGKNEGRFRIESVEQITLEGSTPLFEDNRWLSRPSPIHAREILSAHQAEARRVTLCLVTRLRLKDGNQLVSEPPPFSIILDRLIGRINSLSALYGSGMLIPPSGKMVLLRAADNVRMDETGTTAQWQDWTRPPKPGKQEMSFGGLLGEIVYAGELTPFVPWLALGQWTGVGGKTSFGLGLYHLNTDGGEDEIGL